MGRPRKKTKIDHNSSLDTNQKNTDLVPTDIVNEILQRLPLKSVTKFVRVSKSWATIIRSNYFINSFSLRQSLEFHTQQQEPRRLLFAFNEILDSSKNQWNFFSSTLLIADEKPRLDFISRMVSEFNNRFSPPSYVKGLLSFICDKTQVISNPSTGKSIVLPAVKSRRKVLRRYFGFDPINFEYKVLCIINPYVPGSRFPHPQNQVLTLGSKNWRKIDYWIPHRPVEDRSVSTGICIEGILYYLAYEGVDLLNLILVRFDVRSEKFLKESPCLFLRPLQLSSINLMNYESKLAITLRTSYNSIDLWVLEDGEKLEWLKISPDIYLGIIRDDVRILGITPSGEIVYTFHGVYGSGSFYVIYHDLKKRRCRRSVDIAPYYTSFNRNFNSVVGFIDYVESVMLL